VQICGATSNDGIAGLAPYSKVRETILTIRRPIINGILDHEEEYLQLAKLEKKLREEQNEI
jgi:hypothetical protein